MDAWRLRVFGVIFPSTMSLYVRPALKILLMPRVFPCAGVRIWGLITVMVLFAMHVMVNFHQQSPSSIAPYANLIFVAVVLSDEQRLWETSRRARMSRKPIISCLPHRYLSMNRAHQCYLSMALTHQLKPGHHLKSGHPLSLLLRLTNLGHPPSIMSKPNSNITQYNTDHVY